MLIGAHVRFADPLAAAAATGSDCVQMFLSDPQSWKKPPPRDDAEALRACGMPLYVHAPYLVNVAAGNNKIRIPSRKILQDTCNAAAAIGATAVIVHGGHVASADEMAEGFVRWGKALDILETSVPVYIENTAGGSHAMSRHFETIARLWDVVGSRGTGFCLDTCHAHASGEVLVDAVDRIRAITGRIDLVHCNDSRDEHGSGRDRHENLGKGMIGLDVLVAMVSAAGAPVVCETPEDGLADDVATLRAALETAAIR